MNSRPALEEKARDAAGKARCQRCEVLILEDSSATGVVFGRLLVPLARVKRSYQLCGKCGLALGEFIYPRILDDPVYLEIKRELLERWA